MANEFDDLEDAQEEFMHMSSNPERDIRNAVSILRTVQMQVDTRKAAILGAAIARLEDLLAGR